MTNRVRIILVLCVMMGVITFFTFRDRGTEQTISPDSYSTQTVQEYGFSFTYKSSNNGYMLVEPPLGHEGDGLVKIITFEAYAPQNNTPVPSEAPPQMSILVLENPEQADIRTWAQKNIIYSGFDRIMGEVEERTLGTTKAITYLTDGLYATETLIFTSNGHIVIFLGPYIDKQSELYTDFKMLIESIQVL